jgi:hypothetical protein
LFDVEASVILSHLIPVTHAPSSIPMHNPNVPTFKQSTSPDSPPYQSIITDIEDVSDFMLDPSTCPTPSLLLCDTPAGKDTNSLPLQLFIPKQPPLYPPPARIKAKRFHPYASTQSQNNLVRSKSDRPSHIRVDGSLSPTITIPLASIPPFPFCFPPDCYRMRWATPCPPQFHEAPFMELPWICPSHGSSYSQGAVQDS